MIQKQFRLFNATGNIVIFTLSDPRNCCTESTAFRVGAYIRWPWGCHWKLVSCAKGFAYLHKLSCMEWLALLWAANKNESPHHVPDGHRHKQCRFKFAKDLGYMILPSIFRWAFWWLCVTGPWLNWLTPDATTGKKQGSGYAPPWRYLLKWHFVTSITCIQILSNMCPRQFKIVLHFCTIYYSRCHLSLHWFYPPRPEWHSCIVW